MVHRRTVLAALGSTTLAGCAGTIHLPVDTSPRTLTELTASFDSSALSFSTEIVQEKIDSTRTARFDLSVAWHGDEETKIAFGNHIPFSYPQKSKSEELLLFPKGDFAHRVDYKTWVTDSLGTVFDLHTYHFVPDSSVSRRWEVWGHAKHVNRIPPGEYRFQGTVEYGEKPENDGHQNQGTTEKTVEWTLNMRIARE